MEIATRNDNGVMVVKVIGRLDSVTGLEFEEKSVEWTDIDNARIVIDCSELEYISSYGLRTLLAMTKKLSDSCGKLAICGLSGLVQEVVTVSGFDTIIPIFEDTETAVLGLQ
jgi:anti-anti-sigma factor